MQAQVNERVYQMTCTDKFTAITMLELPVASRQRARTPAALRSVYRLRTA